MIVYCTTNFISQIEQLLKNNSYSAILDDVCSYFSDKDIEELHITKNTLSIAPKKYSLNKYRIINSLSNKGKSSSYRCICACYPPNNMVILDTIYPKTGSDGIDNLSKEAYKTIQKNIKNSFETNKVYVLDITTKTFEKA